METSFKASISPGECIFPGLSDQEPHARSVTSPLNRGASTPGTNMLADRFFWSQVEEDTTRSM